MSNQNSNQSALKQRLRSIALSGSPKVIITAEFLNMVKYLCSNINKVEWSGMLFYDIQGTVRDVTEMVIIPRQILLRDIGTQGHTEFEYDEECMEFVESNDLFMSKYGFIHSHNSMNVFFSPEDKDELQDNAANHNIYLSLIVNNFMDIIAKVIFLGNTPSKFSCPDENGDLYELEVNEPEKVMFMYDCEIDMPKQKFSVSDQFKRIYSDVFKKNIDKAKAAKQATQQAAVQHNLNRSVQQQASGANGYNAWGKSEGYNNQQNFNLGYQEGFDFDNHLGEIEDVEPIYSMFDDFYAYCFNGGAETNIETIDFIRNITKEGSGDLIVNQVITSYAIYYENYYDTNKYPIEEEEFEDVIEEFIEICGQLEADHPWLSQLSTGLRLIGNKFEELNLNKHDTTNDTEV
jgi:hypothetical protein